jgi:hypothetical protein
VNEYKVLRKIIGSKKDKVHGPFRILTLYSPPDSTVNNSSL